MKSLCLSVLCLTPPIVYAAPLTELPAAVTQAFETYTALPGKIVPLLQKAQDTASASAVAPELQKTLRYIYQARELLHNMPSLTPAQNQAVRAHYGQRMREEWADMYTEISRLKTAKCYQSAEFSEAFHLMCMMIER